MESVAAISSTLARCSSDAPSSFITTDRPHKPGQDALRETPGRSVARDGVAREIPRAERHRIVQTGEQADVRREREVAALILTSAQSVPFRDADLRGRDFLIQRLHREIHSLVRLEPGEDEAWAAATARRLRDP
jgi:hypothetical protein